MEPSQFCLSLNFCVLYKKKKPKTFSYQVLLDQLHIAARLMLRELTTHSSHKVFFLFYIPYHPSHFLSPSFPFKQLPCESQVWNQLPSTNICVTLSSCLLNSRTARLWFCTKSDDKWTTPHRSKELRPWMHKMFMELCKILISIAIKCRYTCSLECPVTLGLSIDENGVVCMCLLS